MTDKLTVRLQSDSTLRYNINGNRVALVRGKPLHRAKRLSLVVDQHQFQRVKRVIFYLVRGPKGHELYTVYDFNFTEKSFGVCGRLRAEQECVFSFLVYRYVT